MSLYALLIDTVSIQQYIFNSNRLRDNLGASYIVDRLYQEPLRKALQELYGELWADLCELEAWKQDYSSLQLTNNKQLQVEIAFEGGGKVLLLFRVEEQVGEFTKAFTRCLLLEYPGLRTAVGTAVYSCDKERFKENMKEIFCALNENKSCYFPQIELPSYGINYLCPRTGLSVQERIDNEQDEKEKYISGVAARKICIYSAARELFSNLLLEFGQQNKYSLPERLDQLGQSRGHNYIAIIHMDGNSMGERFRQCGTLTEYRGLAHDTKEITWLAVKKLVKHLIELKEQDFLCEDNNFTLDEINGTIILPVQPIIVGGDDVTLICHGNLGIYLAEYLLQTWVETAENKGREFSACAGVAIIPTKSPFYRGYETACYMCGNAKKMAREHKDSSWLDIYYPGGSTREGPEANDNIKVGGLELKFGPYYLHRDKFNVSLNEDRDLIYLKQGMLDMAEWPRNKLKELRSALTTGSEALQSCLNAAKVRNLSLPNTGYTSYSNEGKYSNKTPYFDLISLMEFYPLNLLQKSLATNK